MSPASPRTFRPRHAGIALASAALLAALAACQSPGPRSAPAAAAAATAQEAPPAPKDIVPTSAAARGPHPGEAVYKQNCAACHDNPEATRSPSLDSLKAMSAQNIMFALTDGKMQVQGAALSAAQRTDLVAFLAGQNAAPRTDWTEAMMCPANRKPVDLSGAAPVAHFGFDRRNTRALTAAQAGLNKAQLADMELAWAIAFPDATVMRAQGAVVGENLFLPVADTGRMYAFDLSDRAKPCLQWVYSTPGAKPLRTSPAYGVTADGTPLLVFSGFDTTVYAVNAKTGAEVWSRKVGTYAYSMTTGTPTVLKDRVIVPVSQFEITVAGSNDVQCCTNQGYIVSLDPRTGEQQWRYNSLPDAEPLRDRGDGKYLFGPSGAPIWNSPTIDEARGLVYFGTGEANSPPAHRNTNAVIAIGLKDGKEKWSFHATERDIFVIGCGPNPKPELLNCVKDTVYRDVDFGASMILGRMSDGKELVFAGQKSGSVWALEPDTGKVVWRRALGTGGPLGGIHWGIAYDKDTVYAPITFVGRPIPGEWDGTPEIKPGIYALDAKTGAIKWGFNPAPPAPTEGASAATGGRGGGFGAARATAMSAAPTVIDGVVFAATLDGRLFAIDAATGKELWQAATAKDTPTINGVPGKGGAIDAASIYAANGLLMVNSGYGMFGQAPGNLLLAYRPKR
jgi:polyvinyl alcohol dehydrogenase (cytochrome)